MKTEDLNIPRYRLMLIVGTHKKFMILYFFAFKQMRQNNKYCYTINNFKSRYKALVREIKKELIY